MAQNATSGYASYCNYGYEATYGSAASGTRVFGSGQKITITRKNNMERLYGLGSRNATTAVAKKYEGSVTVEFNLANASWFRAILGTVESAAAGAAYDHTYSEANTLQSFSIVNGTEMGTLDEVSVLLGCKANTATITASVGEIVKCRIEAMYKTETLATSSVVAQVAEDFDTYTFAQGSLQLPSGSTIGDVQSVELTINNNLEMLWGLGSRLATAGVEKAREYNLRMTVAFENTATLLHKFLGATGAPLGTSTPAAQATCLLTFTNGLTDASERSITITLANVYLDTETLPKDVNELTKEDVEGWALSGTSVVWTNATTSDEGDP